ncbi:hypothetical protein [Parasedimentitalea psychrophila]|uniref:Transporter n=1 Tax=Parasedimentitalea psychrophila TaxID=2997337 RepID=A0A9Y2KXS3_9RHOB|nr:hypothetical protein [Parasedimentitalea psychrophila]WIY24488.1 hypothetical protein QPJ95_18335 [Parasedimentitalea psychrophila]
MDYVFFGCGLVIASLSFSTGATAQSFSAETEFWLQQVIPSGAKDDGVSCANGGTELCSTASGGGVYAGGLVTFENDHQIYLDFTYDEHGETHSTPSSRNDNARYHGFGLHYSLGSEQAPWGLFATWADANNHADDEHGGPLFGIGAEKAWGNTFVQGGYMHMAGDGLDPDHDGIEDMAYMNIGHSHALFNGLLVGNLAAGFGDFEESSDHDDGEWLQLGLRYQQPISDNWGWFIGYQGDFVRVGREFIDEQATFHSVLFGLNLSFGNKSRSRFKTPNFRAPIVNAGELNS